MDVSHLVRADRRGYKAGALANGTASAKGSFLVVLDADFVPDPDLVRLLLPPFRDERVGMVQARWDHANRGTNWLTQAQAFLLDGHFFFYALYYDLVVDTDGERERVRRHVTALADHLIRHDFSLIDHDGRPTRWGHFGPRDLNFDPAWWEERGLNSLSVLAYLKVAEHIADDGPRGTDGVLVIRIRCRSNL